MNEKSCDIFECPQNHLTYCKMPNIYFKRDDGTLTYVSIHPSTCVHRKFIKKCNEDNNKSK